MKWATSSRRRPWGFRSCGSRSASGVPFSAGGAARPSTGSPGCRSAAASGAADALRPGTEALASLTCGDRIVRVNGDTIRSWNALLDRILTGPTTLRFEVARRPEPIVVHLADGGLRTRQVLAQALTRLDPPRLGIVEPG